jgi:hypothetical protein
MKTPQMLKAAIAKYETELKAIRERLEWTQTWLDSANFMQNANLFVAQVDERKELQRREQDMDFKIRFVKWLLEDEQQKDAQNENGTER